MHNTQVTFTLWFGEHQSVLSVQRSVSFLLKILKFWGFIAFLDSLISNSFLNYCNPDSTYLQSPVVVFSPKLLPLSASSVCPFNFAFRVTWGPVPELHTVQDLSDVPAPGMVEDTLVFLFLKYKTDVLKFRLQHKRDHSLVLSVSFLPSRSPPTHPNTSLTLCIGRRW